MYRRRPRQQRRRRRRLRRRQLLLKQMVGSGISRPYVDKRNRLMLGSRIRKKTLKQTGGFFPIRPALTAAPLVLDLLGKIIK